MVGDYEKAVKAFKGESVEGVPEYNGGGWRWVAPVEGGIVRDKESGCFGSIKQDIIIGAKCGLVSGALVLGGWLRC